MIKVEDYMPKSVPQLVDEMITEALRLSKGNVNDAFEHLKELYETMPQVRIACMMWFMERNCKN